MSNEGCACLEGDEKPCGVTAAGMCTMGTATCTDGQMGPCQGAILPAARNCASPEDYDCDGNPDNIQDDVCQCTVGRTRDCGTHPLDGQGICSKGTQTCLASANGSSSSWETACPGSVGPVAEICSNGLDDDCDGTTDGGDSDCCVQGSGAMVWQPGGYCIDTIEVTRARYQAWLGSGPAVGTQDPTNCSWNESFSPSEDCLASEMVYFGNGEDNHPQVCVDWCDASAYCAAMGKRLCGKIGGGSCTGDTADSQREWQAACTSQGANIYGYGNTYQPQTCNGSDYSGSDSTVAVGTLAGCQASGIYDLSGNVFELTSCCSGEGGWGYCPVYGGSFAAESTGAEYTQCTGSFNPERVYTADSRVGFRCCSG